MKKYVILAAILAFLVGYYIQRQKQPEVAGARTICLAFPVTIEAFQRFETEFRHTFSDSKTEVKSFSAEGDPAKFDSIVERCLRENPDIMVLVGTQLTNTAFGPQFRDRLPKLVATCISAPESVESLVAAGIDPPRKLPLAVVSDNPSNDIYAQSAELISAILREGQSPGILFNEGEINSKNTAESLIASLRDVGLDTLRGTVSGPTDVVPVTESLLLKGASLVLIPHDKAATTAAAAVVKVCNEFGSQSIPVFALDDGTVRTAGATFAVSVSYGAIGTMTAETCVEILEGSAPELMPLRRPERASVYANVSALAKLGLPADSDFLAGAVLVSTEGIGD